MMLRLIILGFLGLSSVRTQDVVFFVSYETSYIDLIEEELAPKRCVAVEYPSTDTQLSVYDEYLSIYCTCYGDDFQPVCPKWVISSGQESVYIAESQKIIDGSSCSASLVIGTAHDSDQTDKNVSLRCVIPNTDWKIPEFRFKVYGSRLDYFFAIRYNPLLVYGTLCWLLVLLLYVIFKSFSKRRSKQLKVFSIPELKLIVDKKGCNFLSEAEYLRVPVCEVSVKITEEAMSALYQKHQSETTIAKQPV